MVKSIGSLIVGILCIVVAIAIAVINKKVTDGTIASGVIAVACIYNALRSWDITKYSILKRTRNRDFVFLFDFNFFCLNY